MAQRRMFSPDIIDSDAFLDMPQSSQLLYFHLAMRADDDGFISPKKVMRLVNANNDDLKVLLTKRFLLPFESGVVVIKHWLIHNLIRKDRYKETRYIEEKQLLKVKENGAYTEMATNGLPNGNQMATQVRLGKVRLGKEIPIATETVAWDDIKKLFESFKEINPSWKDWFKNKTQQGAARQLIEQHGIEKLLNLMDKLPTLLKHPYFPKITTPYELRRDFAKLKIAYEQEKSKVEHQKSKVAIIQ